MASGFWSKAAATALLALSSCLAPPPASARVTDAARELNLATRFGRMDVAVGRTAAGARETFVARRSEWGRAIRIVDVELAGLSMPDEHSALLQVDVAWVRADDDTLRSTRLAQVWKDDEGGWRMVREKRMAGDAGLFGEPVQIVRRKRPDVHFASKTIR